MRACPRWTAPGEAVIWRSWSRRRRLKPLGHERPCTPRARRRGAAASAVPDVLGPGLDVVFCGINPASSRRLPRPTSPIRATTSGGCSTRRLHARLCARTSSSSRSTTGIGLTNAAPRTTRGSGDLRRGDFAGAAARLERLALELAAGRDRLRRQGGLPRRVRRAAGARAAGAAPRRDRLFVLPSTSPANAAVPWDERLRWFCELRKLV